MAVVESIPEKNQTPSAQKGVLDYICPTQDGKERKVRDIKLNDEKYLKENMEHEFRIRTELYGQAQGTEYSSGTARSDGRNGTGTDGGTGDSDGTDQRRGMDEAHRSGTQNGGSVGGFDRAESRFEGIGGEFATVMKRAAEAQKEATEKALRKITKEATEQVGEASERASEVIDRRIRRDEALWWLRLALTAVPMLLVLLLWARVGLQM